MLQEIVCKFWNVKHNIGVTTEGKYIAKVNDKVKPVVREVHRGALYYRVLGSPNRVSKKQLNNRQHIVVNYKLQEFCPF